MTNGWLGCYNKDVIIRKSVKRKDETRIPKKILT